MRPTQTDETDTLEVTYDGGQPGTPSFAVAKVIAKHPGPGIKAALEEFVVDTTGQTVAEYMALNHPDKKILSYRPVAARPLTLHPQVRTDQTPLPANAFSDGEPRVTEPPPIGRPWCPACKMFCMEPYIGTLTPCCGVLCERRPEPTLTREETERFKATLAEGAAAAEERQEKRFAENQADREAILAELEAGFAAPEMMTPRETVCDVCGCPGDLSRAEAPGAGETWACGPCQDGSVRK
jgi:hypothetical protein